MYNLQEPGNVMMFYRGQKGKSGPCSILNIYVRHNGTHRNTKPLENPGGPKGRTEEKSSRPDMQPRNVNFGLSQEFPQSCLPGVNLM